MSNLKHKVIFYILGFLIASIIYLNRSNVPIVFDEINCLEISSIIGNNLFDEYTNVASLDIYVLDYRVSNNQFIVKPINNEVVLPINGIVKNKTKNSITIGTTSGDIKISNISNIKYYLYQYYNAYSQLGSSIEYVANGNIELIIDDYKIEYEKV